jgi:hypothetical protein
VTWSVGNLDITDPRCQVSAIRVFSMTADCRMTAISVASRRLPANNSSKSTATRICSAVGEERMTIYYAGIHYILSHRYKRFILLIGTSFYGWKITESFSVRIYGSGTLPVNISHDFQPSHCFSVICEQLRSFSKPVVYPRQSMHFRNI